MDKYEQAIYNLCCTLDNWLYLPFKKNLPENFGWLKEQFKIQIEQEITNLKGRRLLQE